MLNTAGAAATTATCDATLSATADGGTGHALYPDCKSAFASVSAYDRKRAYTMLGAAGVTLAVLFLSRLIWLFEPVLDLIYYGTLSEIVYYIILGVVFTGYVIALNIFIKKHCGVSLFRPKKRTLNIARALGVIAVSAAAVFIASASLDFNLKMQLEMGLGVTLATALTNIAVYIYYGLHLWLGFIGAALVQYALSALFPAKYTVPYGAIFLVTVFGTIELILELYTTTHLYPWLYYLFTYVYAAIFVLTGRSFHVSFWASCIVMAL